MSFINRAFDPFEYPQQGCHGVGGHIWSHDWSPILAASWVEADSASGSTSRDMGVEVKGRDRVFRKSIELCSARHSEGF